MKKLLCLAMVAGWGCWGARLEAQQVNGLVRDVFLNIPGTSVDDLTGDPSFPDLPSRTDVVSDYLEVQEQFDPLTGYLLENFGQRLTGYILAPSTGSYTFWISSDDASALNLSIDESPTNKVTIASVAGATGFRDWTSEPNQTSDTINLQGGRRYYIEVLMKQGPGDNHVSVRWLLPNGSLEEPIPASRLRPAFIPTAPPLITQQPTNTVAPESGVALFSVRVSNVDRVSYQWRRGTFDIPGAVYPTYTNLAATLIDNGVPYSCFITNTLGTTNSAEARLTVIADLTPPTIVSVVNSSISNLLVTYSESVREGNVPSHYALNNGAAVLAATNSPVGNQVVLTTSLLTLRTSYTLTVNGVYDQAANANTIAPDTRVSFVASELGSIVIGQLPAPASFQVVGGGFHLGITGGQVGGLGDQFQFNAQQRQGDFDYRVRVQSLTLTDPWAKAGLMARDGLKTNSVFAAVFATPNIAGCYFEARETSNSLATMQGSFPVNYPYTWLRLQRAGSFFTGYASFDGESWVTLGSANLMITNAFYMGVAFAGDATNQVAVAEVRDFGGVTGVPQIGHLPAQYEPLGPSSRRTPMVISEIMYHPLPQADGKDLEYVELFNSGGSPYNLEGFRLAGDIQYEFPKGTLLGPGSFLVVAHAPADVQSHYQIANVLGGYQGKLSNQAGTVQLLHKSGAVFLDVAFSSAAPWPAAADGAGHSLVLARPSFGEVSPAAWAASARAGGSPGAAEIFVSDAWQTVVINEVLANPILPDEDYLELYNHSTNSVDVGGCGLSDDPVTNKYVFPPGTVILPRGFISLKRSQLGFGLSSAGETIYLTSPPRDRVIDAVRFGASPPGVAMGRYPDGAPAWRLLSAPTPNAANKGLWPSDVVINEIMYHPISGNADDTYVELYNKGTNAVDLSGWKFVNGINFAFPPNTSIPTGGYLVVAKNAAHLQGNYTNLGPGNLVGDFGGNLSKSGERLALSMPVAIYATNAGQSVEITYADAVVNEVRYVDGGRWGQWADGGGSSLELIDPRSDNTLAANWADSVETNKSVWTTIEATGKLDWGYSSGTSYTIDAVEILMGDSGECLVDNLEVTLPGGGNLVLNPTFETGTNGWRFRGTHKQTHLETGEGDNSARSLHVVATGRGDPGPNEAHGDLLTPLNPGDVATIRARARWLKGSPEVLFRLHGNYLEAPGVMTVPANLGTPGQRNRRYLRNAGPAIYDVVHSPIAPAANESVLVTVRVSDPDGLSQLVLNYRLDPDNTTRSVVMTDDGKTGDAVAGDGIYSALIPGQPAGQMVAFSLAATDRGNPRASSAFPAGAPARECLVMFGDPKKSGSYPTYRMWFTQKTFDEWSSREQGSNDPLDVTFAYGNERVIYNTGALYSGSPFHWTGYDTPTGNYCNYVMTFPPDDPFFGASENILNMPANMGSDPTAQREQLAYWMIDRIGLPTAYRRFCHVVVNGVTRAFIYEDAQAPNSEFLQQWYPQDANGDLYKIEDWFEYQFVTSPSPTDPGSTVEYFGGFYNKDATLETFQTDNGDLKTARYRWNWRKRAANGSVWDFRNLLDLVKAVNPLTDTNNYTARVEKLVNIRQWMHVIALRHAVADWDSYGYERGKNMYAYKPLDGGWQLLNWDISFDLGLGDSQTADLFKDRHFDNSIDPITEHMFNNPPFRRLYLQAFQDILDDPFRSENLGPVLDAGYAALQANGIVDNGGTPVQSPATIKRWIDGRRAYIQKVLATNSAPFTLASYGGADFSTNRSLIALEGTAPITVSNITVNGVSYPIQWLTVTKWSMKLPLQPGANTLLVQGFDSKGNLVTNATDQISVTYSGATERPEDRIVINEIMYHPETPNAAYVELFNASTSQAYDLSRWRLHGVDFSFADGTILAPQSYLVVAKNREIFANTYGEDIPAVGDYAGQLGNGGETLSLIKPGVTPDQDTTITEVTYDNVAPWPAAADGGGASLQLIDLVQGDNRVANWTAVGTNGYAPARWQYKSVTGTASGSRLSLSLNGPGEVVIDDLSLVAGLSPAGQNLVANGDFEAPLSSGWTVDASYQGSVVNGNAVHSGNSALHLVSTGASPSEAVYQTIAPALATGQFYTLSYWCRMSETSPVLTVQAEGAGLSSQPDALARSTPGKPNSVKGSLGKLPALWINEVQAENVGAIVTAAGAKAPWIELYNGGTESLDLGGFYLANDATNLARSPLSAGLVLAPKQFLLVWADGQSALSTLAEPHSSFALAPGTGSVLLSRVQAGNATVVDYLHYSGLNAGTSIGGYPDATSPQRQVFNQPTPGTSNQSGVAPLLVRINEWMADNKQTLADPADGKFEDWFELYNGGATTADLSGFTLSDESTNTAKYVIPAGKTIPPRGFLLVWADSDPKQNSYTNQIHTSFKLAKESGYIGLYTPQGAVVDAVNYGAQAKDVSQGRSPDGGPAPFVSFPAPTPGGSNGNTQPQVRIISLVAENGVVTITFNGDPGSSYQLRYKSQLQDAAWTNLGAPVLLLTSQGSVTDAAPTAGQRFYQIAAGPGL